MQEKITLDELTINSVSLVKQALPEGIPWRRAYVNSVSGRAQVESEVSEPYKTAIFAVWGETPTVDENSVD